MDFENVIYHGDFPRRDIGGMCRFIVGWYAAYPWLEYSVEKDASFCFVCYLFKDKFNCAGGDSFLRSGFRNWNQIYKFQKHVGGIDSYHGEAQEKYDLFMRPNASVVECIASTSANKMARYISRLTYSLKCLRFLLQQGLAFRGHNERKDSLNRGNFLELLNWLAKGFEEVNKVVLANAPGNNQMTSPQIQKDLIGCCAKETTKLLIQDLGDEHFAILADESSDVYQQEQMALCLRYVDKKGRVVERFLGIVHVEDTTALTLKTAIGTLLKDQGLSFSMVRGQGYDGASNMKGHANGLKKLIMDESPSAYYVHCFAHQLQLTLVGVAKQSGDCVWFFNQLAYLLNVLGMSCKKIRLLRIAQAEEMIKAFELGDIETGKGMNQEMGLARPAETRWGSHFKTIVHVICLYPSIRKVLTKIGEEYRSAEAIGAQTMLTSFESFEFVFMLHLLQEIFGYSDALCNALQRADQDIVNAIELISYTKQELQNLREDHGWKAFLQEVTSFCLKHKIQVPDMDGFYKPIQRSPKFFKKAKNLHRFHVDMFLSLIDRKLQELNDRFDEVNTDLLICMASFKPTDSFASYDQKSLVKLAQYYPMEFSKADVVRLSFQLTTFVSDMRRDQRFREVKNLAGLSIMLVETKKDLTFPLVYKLLKLILVLPVATASVERVFSSMKYVKNKLRNRMGEQYLNDCLVTFLERDFFGQVKDEAIISRFRATESRRVL